MPEDKKIHTNTEFKHVCICSEIDFLVNMKYTRLEIALQMVGWRYFMEPRSIYNIWQESQSQKTETELTDTPSIS
jgi:hypothetical protein